ncbi:MAG: hypothetical protein IPP17_27110 [Bacteroidetes bacterium]|nr:hypothetical protein [Bacteroidota bacterium]
MTLLSRTSSVGGATQTQDLLGFCPEEQRLVALRLSIYFPAAFSPPAEKAEGKQVCYSWNNAWPF